jgi:hypothetical protein
MPDKRQLAELVCHIHAVSEDEFVGAVKADVVAGDVGGEVACQNKAGFQISRTHFAKAAFSNARVWDDGCWGVVKEKGAPLFFAAKLALNLICNEFKNKIPNHITNPETKECMHKQCLPLCILKNITVTLWGSRHTTSTKLKTTKKVCP